MMKQEPGQSGAACQGRIGFDEVEMESEESGHVEMRQRELYRPT